MDDATAQLVELKGHQAREILNNEIVKDFFAKSRESCYSNIESWSGMDSQELVREALYLKILRNFEADLEGAITNMKALETVEERLV